MKRSTCLFLLILFVACIQTHAQKLIKITTDKTELVLQVAANQRLFQSYLGEKLSHGDEYQSLPNSTKYDAYNKSSSTGWEVYAGLGGGDYFDPALAIEHSDGNLSTILRYQSHEAKDLGKGVVHTIIKMKDDAYPVNVTLHYMAFANENIIKSWTEISHKEKKAIKLNDYVSSMLYMSEPSYFLTEFSGDWAKEVVMSTQQLQFGKKIIDTKLGSRAAMFAQPFFQLGIGEKAQENVGNVLMGTIAWTGNFRFTFEIDNQNVLRILSGINPASSTYTLGPNEVFKTPEFIFTYSTEGTGQASRNFHTWARKHQLKDGEGDRLTLLNNWESTYFTFDEPKLEELMKQAKELGVDMFLLDDGWFANKYPRNDDHAGLGDWEVMKNKLPNGIPHLVKKAKETGVKFGLWVEPEMVNPKSELFEKHPEWAITLPNRETYYFRNQLVLDLSNPKVQDYVFGVVDKIMTENPEIAFLKWDCNSPITNAYSHYLKDKQSHLYINHVKGVYEVFRRVTEKYPTLPMMMCAGGGGRCDYEGLKYFTEFWCSDNTDPVERLFIQWGFSQFFPAKAMDAHVTTWNKSASIKFRTDVAMMCKFGFDINLEELKEDERIFCQTAVGNFKRLKKVILDGDLYRLVSPYQGNHTSVMYVDEKADNALLYAYDIYPRYDEKNFPVKLQGLDPKRMYKIEEINLMPNAKSTLGMNGKILSGDYLMKVGIDVFTNGKMNSKVIEIKVLIH